MASIYNVASGTVWFSELQTVAQCWGKWNSQNKHTSNGFNTATCRDTVWLA